MGQHHNFITKPSRKDKVSNELKLTGAYAGIYIHPVLKNKEIGAFFLYENGVALFYEPINFIEDYSKNADLLKKQIFDRILFQDNFFKRKQAGGYIIQKNVITIQIFRYMPYGGYSLCTFNGRILNDKSIYIYKCNMPDKPVYCRENFQLNFIQMEKPDSTNRLMKNSWYWQKL